jgi:hypothetical protein
MEAIMLSNKICWKIFSIFLLAVFVLMACTAPPAPTTPVPGTSTRPTLDPKAVTCGQPANVKQVAGAAQWNCPQADGRTLVIANVPDGVTPYNYAFDEGALLKQQTDYSIAAPISVVADIRFFRQVNGVAEMVYTFDTPVEITMTFTEADSRKLADYNSKNGTAYKLSDLIPIDIVPDKYNTWKRFPDGTVQKIENGVVLTIFQWGDPPTGWGIAKGR